MELAGWGRFPRIDSEIYRPRTASDLAGHIRDGFCGIARGMGRSYGDSSLAARTISTGYLNHLLSFDESSGIVVCSAGITLAEMLQYFVPRGWCLAVLPGTRHVSIGGAIASDVHGKNHHVVGSFCDHLRSMELMLADGEVVSCSTSHNAPLFHASCGGMGLTGIILKAEIQLMPISSSVMIERCYRTRNLEETLELLDQHTDSTYSVAWTDCMSTGKSLGRSLVYLAEHETGGHLDWPDKTRLSVPVDMPGFLLNRYSVSLFNTLYYQRVRKTVSERRLAMQSFFFPLDGISDWNRLYGKQGFVQYQFVIPRSVGLEGLTVLLQRIVSSGRASFLSVLKLFGPANDNYLSFPLEGYTLALDFRMDSNVLSLLDELDEVVMAYGGRVYLSKDARTSAGFLAQGYPLLDQFRNVRETCGGHGVFQSLQSERLCL